MTAEVTTVGDHKNFTFTGYDANGNPEDITGHSIIFKAYDELGNAISKDQDAGIVILSQVGATLGQATVQISPTDYPAAWLALEPRKKKLISVEIVHINGQGIVHTTHADWWVQGQAIITDFQVYSDEFGGEFG